MTREGDISSLLPISNYFRFPDTAGPPKPSFRRYPHAQVTTGTFPNTPERAELRTYDTAQTGLPYFDRAALVTIGSWCYTSALNSMRAKLCFHCCSVNIGPSYTQERVKVVFCPQNVKNGNYILLGIPENKGGRGNPSAPIDVNAFRTTDFRS